MLLRRPRAPSRLYALQQRPQHLQLSFGARLVGRRHEPDRHRLLLCCCPYPAAPVTIHWPDKELQVKKLHDQFVQAVNRYVYRTHVSALEGLEDGGTGELLDGRSAEVKAHILALMKPLVPPPPPVLAHHSLPRGLDLFRLPPPLLPSTKGACIFKFACVPICASPLVRASAAPTRETARSTSPIGHNTSARCKFPPRTDPRLEWAPGGGQRSGR